MGKSVSAAKATTATMMISAVRFLLVRRMPRSTPSTIMSLP
ncbi:MAG: hypothetical protein R2838_06450 [Caldilineaceae bacterium]